MIKDKETYEIIGLYFALATSFVVYILPWLQFIAVVLTITLTIKKLIQKRKLNV